MSIQAALAEHLANQSRWREMKAEEYPDDARNQWSADALQELADTIGNATPEDWEIEGALRSFSQTIADIWPADEQMYFGEGASRFISRYGFDRGHQTGAAKFIEELQDWVREDDEMEDG